MRVLEFFSQFRPAYVNPGSQTKPYHTKPGHFRPIFKPFWPIFRSKVPESKWIWFGDIYPLNQWGVLSVKILVSPFGQFKKHHFGSADMCTDNPDVIIVMVDNNPVVSRQSVAQQITRELSLVIGMWLLINCWPQWFSKADYISSDRDCIGDGEHDANWSSNGGAQSSSNEFR